MATSRGRLLRPHWSTSSRCNLEVDTLVELYSDRTAREKELLLFANAARQEREDIKNALEMLHQKELEKQEKKSAERRSAVAGRSVADVLRDAPLADAHFNSRGGVTLDHRTRSRSHGR